MLIPCYTQANLSSYLADLSNYHYDVSRTVLNTLSTIPLLYTQKIIGTGHIIFLLCKLAKGVLPMSF